MVIIICIILQGIFAALPLIFVNFLQNRYQKRIKDAFEKGRKYQIDYVSKINNYNNG